MNFGRRWMIILLIWQIHTIANAQDVPPLNFGHITTENGLSHNTISRITQDTKGFIWFSTFIGLNRYDGQTVEVFLHDSEDSTSISNSTIWGLKATTDGAVWIGTSNGLNRYDYRTNVFQRIYLPSQDSETFNIWDIEEDKDGNIWLATPGRGLYKVSPVQDTNPHNLPIEFEIKHFVHDPDDNKSLASNLVYYLHRDLNQSEFIWVTTMNGLGKLNTNTATFEFYENDPYDPSSISTNSISRVINSNDGHLWVCTNNNGIDKMNIQAETFTNFRHSADNPYSISANKVAEVVLDNNGKLWTTILGKGISILADEQNGVFHNYEHEPANPSSLSINTINPLFKDTQGNIWLGSNGGGCNYYNPNQSTFPLFQHNSNDLNSICASQLRAIFEDSKGNIWLSSSVNGISVFKLNDNAYQIENIKHYFSSPDKKIKNLSSQVFMETKDGLILMGARNNGVYVFDPQKNQFRDYLYRPNDLDLIKSTPSFTIFQLSNNNILFGTFNGIYEYDIIQQETALYVPTSAYSAQNKNFTIQTLYEDKAGKIYIGSPYDGYIVCNPLENSLVNYVPNKEENGNISTNNIICFHADQNGYHWLGTWDGGLNRFDPKTGQFKIYTEKDGLANNTIYSIQEDKEGNLWLSTNKGLSKFDPIKESFTNFDTSHNLQGDEFNSRVGFTNKDWRMYFGGMNGLNIFNPENIFADTSAPKLYLTELIKYQDDGSVEEKNIIHKKHITLKHIDKTLAFKFAALKLPKIKNFRYEYFLEGYNSDWIDLGTTPNFNLTNLDQGEYQLKIRAISTDKAWNAQEIKLGISMLPPWWKTWWAFLLYVLLISGLLYTIYRYRLRQILKYQRLRTKISSDLHDDVGSILTAAVMQTEILSWTLPEEEASKFNQIVDLNRKAIERMRDTVWAIDSQKDNMDSLIDRMKDFIFDLSDNARLKIDFQHNISQKDRKIPPNVRQSLYLIFKEALNNAMKYSNGDKVDISLLKKGKEIHLSIKDNGQVDASKIKTSGLGLKNMKMRASNVNGSMKYRTNDGFEIICTIPL